MCVYVCECVYVCVCVCVYVCVSVSVCVCWFVSYSGGNNNTSFCITFTDSLLVQNLFCV